MSYAYGDSLPHDGDYIPILRMYKKSTSFEVLFTMSNQDGKTIYRATLFELVLTFTILHLHIKKQYKTPEQKEQEFEGISYVFNKILSNLQGSKNSFFEILNFFVFQSDIEIKNATPKIRTNKGKIQKTPLLSDP